MTCYAPKVDYSTRWGFVPERPLDERGESLHVSEVPSGMRYTLTAGLPPPVPDMFKCIGHIWLYSARVMECIEGLALPPSAQWTEVTIIRRSKVEHRRYMLTCPEQFEVLDRDNATFKWLVEGIVMDIVDDWLLRADRVPAFDLFRADDNSWLVSERFVRMFQKHGFDGPLFEPCRMT
jgi:hypothetical protein